MTIYSNGVTVRLPIADGMPPLTRPLIRPVPDAVPGYQGAAWTAGLDANGRRATRENQVWARVTPRRHWWLSTDGNQHFNPGVDPVCRSCSASAPNVRALDSQRCMRPAGGQDITSALLGRTAVAA